MSASVAAVLLRKPQAIPNIIGNILEYPAPGNSVPDDGVFSFLSFSISSKQVQGRIYVDIQISLCCSCFSAMARVVMV